MSDAHWLTATEISAAYAARQLSPVELVRALLDRIAALDPRVHAFIKVDAEAALDAAAAGRARDRRRPHARPVFTACPSASRTSSTWPGFPPRATRSSSSTTSRPRMPRSPRDCARPAPIILGKLALHEFAIGGPAFDLPFPPARNPWNTRSPSGRLLLGLRRRPRRRARAARARHRYGRLRPQPRRRVRCGRAEADVWAGVAPRRVPAGLHARSRRPHGALRRRHRAPARHAGRARPGGSRQRGDGIAPVRGRSRPRGARPAHRVRSPLPRDGPAGRSRDRGRARRGRPRPRGRGRARPNGHPAVTARLLRSPAGDHARRILGHSRRLAARAPRRLQRLRHGAS